ncbi:uncharacterized protein ACO6RY_15770 [Pungitius sinensis]
MAADNRLVTAEAVSLLRNLLQSPTLINSISNSVSPTLMNSVPTPSNAAVNSEIRSFYEPGSSNMQTAPAPVNEIQNYCPRYQTRATYSTWKSKPRQKVRQKTPYHRTFNKDVILLLSPTDDIVVKQRKKEELYKRGHILNAFEFDKTWDQGTVLRQIRDSFKGKIPEDVR